MPLNLGVMSAAVTLDDAEYRRGLSGLESASGNTFQKIAQLAATYLSLRVFGNFLHTSIKVFSDLEEETNKFNVVFQGLGKETGRILGEMRKDFGLSELAAKKMLAGTGDILTGFGFDRKTALDLSDGTAKLAADIASFSNYAGGAEGATTALTKAMLGEYESAKMLGVVIRQDDENYKAFVKQAMTTGVTIDALGKTFVVSSEQQAKAVAALAIAYQQSPNAIGDFVRSQGSIANQTRILQNNFQQLYSTIGGDLSGSYQDALQFSNSLLNSVNKLNPASRNLLYTTVALGVAFTMLSKTGMVDAANKSLQSMMMGTSGIRAKTEADVVTATENMKRAEIAKTDAFRESRAAAQSLRVAKLAVQEQQAAVMTAKIQMQSAEASGDAAQILAARRQLATASQALTKAQLAESTATQQLAAKHSIARTANMQHAVAAKACAVANATNATASTMAGRAQVVLAAGLTKARVAATAFATALGPVGAALIALSGMYMAYQYISEKNRNTIEAQVEQAQRNVQATKEMADARAKERTEATAHLSRLQELSQYERMNNSEKEEAERLIDFLTKKYGDLGISIDDVTGKLNIGADAWKKMNTEQERELTMDLGKQMNAITSEAAAMQIALRDQLSSFWKNTVIASGIAGVGNLFGSDDNTEGDFSHRAKNSERQQELDRIMKLQSVEKQITGLEQMRNSLTAEGEKEQAKAVDELIKKLREYQKLQKELDAARKAQKQSGQGSQVPGQTEADRKKSEAERRAITSLSSLEWDINFDTADDENKARMLSEKIDEIFAKQSGKYGDLEAFKNADRNAMMEKELKDLQEIIRLEEQRRKIRENSARMFEEERDSYANYMKRRQKQDQELAVEKELEKAKKAGDKAGADKIIQEQVRKSQEAAKRLQEQYQQTIQEAEADQIMTDEEKRRIAELRSKMQAAFSDQDKWQSRVDGIEDNEKKQKDVRKTAVAWSSELLNAQLFGPNKPEEETAKNTKKSMEFLREIKNNVKNNFAEVLR